MDWNLIWTIVGAVIAVVGMLGSLILYLNSCAREDFKEFRNDFREFTKANSIRLDKIEDKLGGIEQRLARMEGTMQERGYWESRLTGTEKK